MQWATIEFRADHFGLAMRPGLKFPLLGQDIRLAAAENGAAHDPRQQMQLAVALVAITQVAGPFVVVQDRVKG